MKLSERGIRAAIRGAHWRISLLVRQREELERELQFEDQRLASLQGFREELERAKRSGDEDRTAYLQRAIRELLAQPTIGPIDSPLVIAGGPHGRSKIKTRRATVG